MKFNRGFRSKLRDGWIWYNFYYGTGLGWYDKVKQPAMVLTALGAITYFKLLPQWVLYFFVPLWFVGWFSVGLFEFKVLKIPQRNAIISGSRISPWEKQNRNLLNETRKEVKWIKKKLSEI